MSIEQRPVGAGQETWKAPKSESRTRPKTPDQTTDTAGPPIFDLEGVKTVVPRTIETTAKNMRQSFESLPTDRIVFPEADKPTVDATPERERSILDHNEPLPPSPAMQKFRNVISKFRIPAILLGGLMAAKGATAGAEAYQNLEAKETAAESALLEARDAVGGGLAEFAEAHRPSSSEIVTLSDGTEMSRAEWTAAVDVAMTESNFLKIDTFGNPWGGNGKFAKEFSKEIPRSAMEDGLHRVQAQQAELSAEFSPIFGAQLDAVADSMLRDRGAGASAEAGLRQAIEKTYGASAPDVLAKLEASGSSLRETSESLVRLLQVESAEKLYQSSLEGNGPVYGHDAGLVTDAYGSTLRMNDATYDATAQLVGLSGADEMKIHGKMMTTHGDGGVYHEEATMAGPSVHLGGLGDLEGGVNKPEIQKDMAAFASAFTAGVIKSLDLSHADSSVQESVVDATQDFLSAQMGLVEAQARVVEAEGDASALDGMAKAGDKVELSLKILKAASGENSGVSQLTKEVLDGNAAAAAKFASL